MFIYLFQVSPNPMSDERYGKCDVCRFCVNSDDDWACMVNNKVVHAKGSCPRYRPGCCENCSHAEISFGKAVCKLTGEETDILSVCNHFDPCGRNALSGQ